MLEIIVQCLKNKLDHIVVTKEIQHFEYLLAYKSRLAVSSLHKNLRRPDSPDHRVQYHTDLLTRISLL